MYFVSISDAFNDALTTKIIIRSHKLHASVKILERTSDKSALFEFAILSKPQHVASGDVVAIWNHDIKCVGRVV
jgi:hypothetical protein